MTKRLPLEGLKVVDFSWAIAGPVTAKYLAIFGAHVIKVESNSRLDNLRIGPPFVGKPGRNNSAFFANHNPSKMSISLNLKSPEAVELAKKLVAWGDLVVENFSAGQMAEFGLDYEVLRKVNPRVIMLSSSQQGQTGPYAAHPGLGQLLMGHTGFVHFTGWPDRPPTGPAVPYPDMIAPWFSLVSIISALEYRDRTGKGQYLDLSQMEGSIQYLSPQMLDYVINGREGQRHGNFSDEACPHNAYGCLAPSPLTGVGRDGGDRWCAISVHSDDEWRAFRRVLGDPAWASEARFATHLSRLKNVDEVDRLVNEWTSKRSAEEVMRVMQEAGVPAAVVANGKDLAEDPQLQHRGHVVFQDHPGKGRFPYDAPSFRMSNIAPEWRPAPNLGQHTEQVCREILGLSDEQIKAYTEKGAFA